MMIIFIEFDIYLVRRVAVFPVMIMEKLFIIMMQRLTVDCLLSNPPIIAFFSLALSAALSHLSKTFSSCLVVSSR